MKNIEALYKEVMENEALKAEFATAYREGNVSEFLKKHDCDATAEEVSEYVNGVKDEALSLDDLDNVAGGGKVNEWGKRVLHKVADMWSEFLTGA